MNDITELKQAIELLSMALAILNRQVVVSSSDIERVSDVKSRIEKKVKNMEARLASITE